MKKEGSIKALLPLLVFLIGYIGISAIAGDMYAVSVIIPFSAAAITALIMNKDKSLNEIPELEVADNMPAKWQILISLGQQTIMHMQETKP